MTETRGGMEPAEEFVGKRGLDWYLWSHHGRGSLAGASTLQKPVPQHPGLPSSGYDAASYWNDRLGRHYGFVGVGDRTLGEAYNRWMYRVREAQFRRAVAATGLDLRAARILEIAPGIGFYVNLWHAAGVRDLTCVDISVTAVERLAPRFPEYRFLVGDVGAAEPPFSGDFDLVTAIDVLYHIADDIAWARAIGNIGRSLRPGGYFVFTDSLPSERRRVAGPHVVKRGRASYLALLASMQLRLVGAWPFSVLMQPPDATAPSTRALAMWLWDRFHALFYRTWGLGIHEQVGEVLGAAGFVADRVLGSLLHLGPAIRLWLFQKSPSPGPSPATAPARGGS